MRLAQVRRSGLVPYLRPDGKTQVTIVYEDGTPVAIDTVLDLDPARGRHRLDDDDQGRRARARHHADAARRTSTPVRCGSS